MPDCSSPVAVERDGRLTLSWKEGVLTVLVRGATGQLNGNLVRTFVERRDHVRAFGSCIIAGRITLFIP